jgi:hypothetical protein
LPDAERDKIALIIQLAVDVVLITTMFFGLLRFRGRGTGMFGLARLLWKQVGLWQSLIAVSLSFSNVVYFVCKGLIWLLFATGAGVITVASVASSLAPLRSQTFCIAALRFFGSDTYFLLSDLS